MLNNFKIILLHNSANSSRFEESERTPWYNHQHIYWNFQIIKHFEKMEIKTPETLGMREGSKFLNYPH